MPIRASTLIQRTRTLSVLVIAIMATPLGSTARGQHGGSQREWPAGVSALLGRFDSTASSATTLDAAGRSALFTDDAIFLNAFGNRVDGRPGIDSAWHRLYGGRVFGAARIERLDRRVRLLAPDLVLVDHLERLTGQRAGGGTMEPRTTHITLVLRQQTLGNWRIVYYRAGDNRSIVREREERASLNALQNDWAGLDRYRGDNARLRAPVASENRVVFFGNSITEGWASHFTALFPGKPYIGRGISGQTTPQLLVRFNQDVVALRPKVVVILAGTNDIAGNTGPATLEMIEQNLRSMTEIALANRIRVVLSSVLPVYDYPWRPGLEPAGKVVALNAWMKSYAASVGAIYLDYHSAMADARQGLRADLSNDGVHPTEGGYRVMAPLAEKAIAAALRR